MTWQVMDRLNIAHLHDKDTANLSGKYIHNCNAICKLYILYYIILHYIMFSYLKLYYIILYYIHMRPLFNLTNPHVAHVFVDRWRAEAGGPGLGIDPSAGRASPR